MGILVASPLTLEKAGKAQGRIRTTPPTHTCNDLSERDRCMESWHCRPITHALSFIQLTAGPLLFFAQRKRSALMILMSWAPVQGQTAPIRLEGLPWELGTGRT